MTGNNYQSKAMRTATLKCFDPANAALGLTGEAGEKRGVRSRRTPLSRCCR